jgi:hypothetical protein
MRAYPTLFVKACQGGTPKTTLWVPDNPRLCRTVVSRCNISDHEFDEVFDTPQECLLAAFDQGLARVSRVVEDAAKCADGWHERVRAALSALLVFLDEEPGWARLLIQESPADDSVLDERRREALAGIVRALVIETQAEANSSGWFVPASELTAELVVAGVFSVLRTRMLEGVREPFTELAPSLTAFVTAPYPGARRAFDAGKLGAATEPEWRAQRLPVRTTYRTTRVLSAIGDSRGLSNREIAGAAGLSDEGQTSRLLRRLEQRGLLQNVGLGHAYGGANAWLLTAYGQRVLDATRHSLVPGAGAISSPRVRGAA